MNNENVLDKVAALLKLAENNTNENDAAQAVAEAQQLLAECRLANVDTESEEIEMADEPLFTAKRVSNWRKDLANAVAKANGCVVFTSQNNAQVTQGPSRQYTLSETSIKLVGRASDVAAVRYVFEHICNEIDRQHAIARATGRVGKGKAAGSSFRLEATSVVCAKLSEAVSVVKALAAEAGQTEAIVKLDSADNEVVEFYSALNLGKSKPRKEEAEQNATTSEQETSAEAEIEASTEETAAEIEVNSDSDDSAQIAS